MEEQKATKAATTTQEHILRLFNLSPAEHQLVTEAECQHRRKGKLSSNSGHLFVFSRCLAFHDHAKASQSFLLTYDKIQDIQKCTKLRDHFKHKFQVYQYEGPKLGFKKFKNRD
jgi:hypothetical protein